MLVGVVLFFTLTVSSCPASGGVFSLIKSKALSRIRQRQGSPPSPWSSVPVNPEAFMTSPEIIRNRGYPVEIHHVTTDDGYILEMHRIPYSRRTGNNNINNKTVVFMQHGLLGTDSLWLIQPTDKCLAFLLADRGYDVWLGNTRGNIYSRRHVKLDAQSADYWRYSWDQLGYYDVPAFFDYVLNVTGKAKLVYVGGSLGSSIFFIAMARHPQLNSRVDRMFALTPLASRKHSQNPFRRAVDLYRIIRPHIQRATNGAVLRNGIPPPARQVVHWFCRSSYSNAARCRDLMIGPSGNNPDNFDLTILPTFLRHFPLGTSLMSIDQLVQNYKSEVESFNSYDYGPGLNQRLYGTLGPRPYNLSLVTAPVHLFWSQGDLIVTPQDTAWLASQLGNLAGSHRIADLNFTHLDFALGFNVNQVVNLPILDLMPPP